MAPIKVESRFNLRELIEQLETNLKKKTIINKPVTLMKKAAKQLQENSKTEDAQQIFKQNVDKLFKKNLHDVDDPHQTLDSSMDILRIESVVTKEFPKEKLQSLLQVLLLNDKSNTELIIRFGEYTRHPDVFSNVWKALLPLSENIKSANETRVLNFLELLNLLRFSKEIEEETNFTAVDKKSYDYFSLRKVVNKVWVNVMLVKYSETTLKKMLVVLLENVLPHLDKPIMLTDFLTESLEVGGTVALLALQGIFILIQKHNLAFPDIYNRVYSMFEPNVCQLEYKTRLFQLADIFLTSTHLPETLVAAFAKRLSRLSLSAPASDQIIICRFIGNLVIRHPGLKAMMHHDKPGLIDKDPFDMSEADPLKSRALESQLWEIHALQSHFIPTVSKAASFISKTLPEMEWDLTEVLDANESELLAREVNKSYNSGLRKVRVVQKVPKSFITQAEKELFAF